MQSAKQGHCQTLQEKLRGQKSSSEKLKVEEIKCRNNPENKLSQKEKVVRDTRF